MAYFGDSDEFLAIVAANPTSDELIDQLYQFMFNRDASFAGNGTGVTVILDGDDTFTTAMNIMGVVTDYGTTAVTGTDIFKLDINIAGTEFDDMMIGTALPVLQINTDSTGPLILSGTVANIGANMAIGDGTAALPVLAGETAAHTFLTGLATTALFNNKQFVLFATNGTFVGSSQLVAYLITANPTKTASIAASEVHSLTGGIIAALGAGGVMAEVDLILI